MAQTLLFKTYWEAQSLIPRILRLIGHILNNFLLGGKTILSGKRKESLWKSMQDILEMTISSYQGNLRLNLYFAFKKIEVAHAFCRATFCHTVLAICSNIKFYFEKKVSTYGGVVTLSIPIALPSHMPTPVAPPMFIDRPKFIKSSSKKVVDSLETLEKHVINSEVDKMFFTPMLSDPSHQPQRLLPKSRKRGLEPGPRTSITYSGLKFNGSLMHTEAPSDHFSTDNLFDEVEKLNCLSDELNRGESLIFYDTSIKLILFLHHTTRFKSSYWRLLYIW